MSNLKMSWSDRFAVIDHFKPSDAQILTTFGLTQDELDTARLMRDAGTFEANPTLDVIKFQHVFVANAMQTPVAPISSVSVNQPLSHVGTTITVPTVALPKTSTKQGSATSYVKPETATKKVKAPQKRGRKGDKIVTALQAVPTERVSVEEFCKQHGVSLAVLRQSKRFLEQMTAEQRAAIGKINVRQDKESRTLMIWRDPNPS